MSQPANTLNAWDGDELTHYRAHRSPQGMSIIVSVVHKDGWSVCGTDHTKSYPKGPETGDAGKTAADRKAVELGWVLEGGVFGEPAPEQPKQPKQHTLGEWTEQDGYHTRKTPDGPVVVEVRAGWWHVDGTDRGSESRRGYFSVEHAKERADQVAQRLGWTLTGGAFKAPVSQAESKPTHRPYRLIIGSRARALREAAESARSIFPVDALRNAAFDLAWSVEQLDQVREAALKVGEEMAADLEKLERERDEALRERNEAKAARDEALRQVGVERERADTNENLAREVARLTRDFREEVTKASIAAFTLGWDAAIRCRDILKDTP